MNLKARYVASITVIIIGFFSAQLTSGRVPSVVFYWLGFFLIFGIKPISKTTFSWQKWGRRGLIVNIVLTAVLILFLQIIIMYPSNSEYTFYGLRGLSFLLKPISHGVDLVFPNERLIMPGGSVQMRVSYVKSAFTNLLDVISFIAAGIIVGRYVSPEGRRI